MPIKHPERRKILVVDDDEDQRFLAVNFLKKLGFCTVEEAEGGEDALRKITLAEAMGLQYNEIFLDWQMPVRDGLSVYKDLCKMKIRKRPRVIMLTSMKTKKDVVSAASKGIKHYLLKPLNGEEAEKRVLKILES